MESKIDFSTYSLEELNSSAQTIDREKYPERAKEIDDLINQKNIEINAVVEKEVGEKASRGDRFIAAVIDGVIGIAGIIPVVLYVGLEAFEEPSVSLLAFMFLYGLVIFLLFHGYLLANYAQTIGKHFLSIRIENLDGTQASFTTIFFKRLLVMQVIAQIPMVGTIIAGLINPLFIFAKEKRCLHDYIAQTKVSYTAK